MWRRQKTPATRAANAARFRLLLLDTGLKLLEAAHAIQLTERTCEKRIALDREGEC